jgi:ribosomal protein S18 acetylase RimI-like enzyme
VFIIRQANENDLDFIERIDLEDEGGTTINKWTDLSPGQLKEHHLEMQKFVLASSNTGKTEWDTCPKFALLCTEKGSEKPIGLIMFLFRDMNNQTFNHFEIFNKFDRDIFPPDGKICEIFQLWVAPEFRRKGIATALKNKAEETAIANNISMMYTHTLSINTHIVDMNMKLGYHVVREGPLWDREWRTSLVKKLNKNSE